MKYGDWFFIPRNPLNVRLRLVCFSPAGLGAGVFRTWVKELPYWVELCAVELPGKGARRGEPAIGSIPRLAELISRALIERADRPFAFFGHSMGAILACETAHVLRASGQTPPVHLFASGRRPPEFEAQDEPIAALPDEAFVREINVRYGGIPPEVLANPDVLAILLPGLRADMAAIETFRPQPRPPFTFPIAAFGGASDPMTPLRHLEEWRSQTEGPFETRLFPGGHFYIDEQKRAVTGEIIRLLSPALLTEA